MRVVLTCIVLLLLTPDSRAQQDPAVRLLIVVRDAETDAPLAGANVAVGNTVQTTNLDGRALFSGLETGNVGLAASFLGYVPIDTTLTLERSSRVTFLLTPDEVELDAIRVEADKFNAARLARSGFYERQETRSGTFLTIEELEASGAVKFADIFRGVSGVRIESQFGRTRLASTRRRECTLSIYFDGILARGLGDQLDTVPLDGVLAVEIYRGPSEVPAEYTATVNGAECGAVLIWTRAR